MKRRELYDTVLKVALPLYGEREAGAIAYLLLEALCNITRVDIALEPNAESEVSVRLAKALRELAQGRPLQYIVGSTHFAGLEIAVREGVLIPRPETEELVRWISEEWEQTSTKKAKMAANATGGTEKPLSPTILDIGTGSGAIALALADGLKGSTVVGVDVSEVALEVARENAVRNNLEVNFERADILSFQETQSAGWCKQQYDIVVSNPPYIPISDREKMHINVTEYEPHEALFVDIDNPLIFYKMIAHRSQDLLKRGGMLYFEIYEHFGVELVELLSELGYRDIEVRKDINDKQRMIRCRKR